MPDREAVRDSLSISNIFLKIQQKACRWQFDIFDDRLYLLFNNRTISNSKYVLFLKLIVFLVK